MPLSTLQTTPRGVARKTRGQDGFATSFPVGLFHPLQHAGLSRRSPDYRPTTQNPISGTSAPGLKASLATPGWDKGSGSRHVRGDYKTLRRFPVLNLPETS